MQSRTAAAAAAITARMTVRRRLSSAATCRAAVCEALGEPLRVTNDWPMKPLHADSVRIKVAACGVNFADLLTAKGLYQDRSEPPFVPGNELAGEVVAIGDGVHGRFAVGDRVISLARGGAYASEATVSASHCLKLPASAASKDLAEAAALLCNYGTAHLALSHRARLQPGETVLVTAAAGGVGLATTELAALMGARRVIALASSEEKLALAAAKGAEAGRGVNYGGGLADDPRALKAAIKAAGGDDGIDVVVDMVGASVLEPCVRSLNWNGRAVVVGFAGGHIPRLPVNLLLVKNVSVSGLFWGAHLIHDPKALLRSAEQLVEWWAAGEVTPHVCARLPLEEANAAFAMIEGRASTGKVVLIP